MFSRIFGRAASLRRSLGLGAFLLALGGGFLAIWAAIGSSASTLIRALQVITGLGAMIAGRRIYQRSQALLFPRSRMNMASILAAVVGAIMLIVGFGLPGILVLAAGLVGFVGAAF
jgi:uncharacterized membrane protein (DUF2068 family)